MPSLSDRPIYTQEQLKKYLSFIKYAHSSGLDEVLSHVKNKPLKTLKRLQRKQLAAIPFGNLVLHYSTHHTVSLDTEALYTKMVDRNLGGYCMENNTFFSTILRSLGYQLYTTGARVSAAVDSPHKDPESFGGWNHMVVLVTIEGKKYMVDAGFGSMGACAPMLLKDNEMIKNVPTAEGRLAQRTIWPYTDTTQRLWVFENRGSPEALFKPAYCFSELEFIPADFEPMNFWTSQSRKSWFTRSLVLTKVLLGEDEEPLGTLTLNGNEIARRLHGQVQTVATCKTEKERWQALDEWFNVKLRDDEKRGIEGLISEIRALPAHT